MLKHSISTFRIEMSHERVAENSKNLARKYVKEGIFGRAFSHYLVALKLNPDWREEFREEFVTVLCKWGTKLEETKRYSDLFECYEQASDIFPDNVVILNNLGAHLLRCGRLKEAAYHFRMCIDIDRYYIRAAYNLESVANLAVERWHFRMLNDEHRNEAFREAILKKVRGGFRKVLDVGTGTGILSLFCSEGKAEEIYACDSSPIMTDMAEYVFYFNKAHVCLLTKHSTDIQIPADIPKKLPLLVTETFDAALLGEDILHTLSHAWEKLLLPPHPSLTSLSPDSFGLVLPFGAVVYATGVEFQSVANDLHLRETPNGLLLEHCSVLRNCDNYDTHDLSRSTFRCLTPTQKILQLNFNDPKSLSDVSEYKKQVSFRCSDTGRLDCFAVWFDLHLDEDIVLSTSPLSKNNTAWDQAIFPLPRSIPVVQQQDVNVSIEVRGGKLCVTYVDDNCRRPTFELSEAAVKTLQDDRLGKGLQEVANELQRRVAGCLDVLDCYPFPVLGLKLVSDRGGRLSCVVPSEGDRKMVEWMAEKHGFEAEVLVRNDGDWGGWFEGKRFDVIVLDLVETSGEIKDWILLELHRFKSLLKPNGIIIPEKVTVVGQFLYSDWLARASRVLNDSVTCGYKIAEYINIFQTRHFIDLEMKTIDKKTCTEPVDLFSLLDYPLESVSEKIVPVTCNSPAVYANAMVYWLRIRFLECCEEMTTSEASSYRQAAFLFPKSEFYQNVKFNVVRSDGLFNIELLH